jgi:hypothetical protein
MFVNRLFLGRLALFPILTVYAAFPAHADDETSEISNWTWGLTEASEPESKAWEDPARLSFTIDPKGKDTFSAQINAEVKRVLSDQGERNRALTANVVWNRETSESAKQNNFEIGAGYEIGYSYSMLDRGAKSDADQAKKKFDAAYQFGIGYARTANYGDASTVLCIATPSLRQCGTEFAESVRGTAALNFFNPLFENFQSGFGFSFEPQIGAAIDYRLNNPINVDTGIVAKGGYGSISGGIILKLLPDPDAPDWEIKLSAKVRQTVFVSASREDEIRKTAELLKASATYYFVKPSSDDDWRAGLGVTYTRGGDPLAGNKRANSIVFSLRIGRY